MPRVMEITTPLGDDVLLFHGMHARDEMSRLGEWDLDLVSLKNDIDVDAILGKNVTVKLALPDDSTRYFNGYVTRFSQGGIYGRYYRYFARVHPWLWFLTRTADCRIFQEMKVPDILKLVFDDHPTASVKFELTSTYRKWTYCVQYRETDFNFVSRLMEHEGIYYYFRHEDGKHTLVLTDSSSKHVPTAGYEELKFIAPGQIVRPEYEHISSWDFSSEVQPGVYAHDDYDLERPSVELLTQKKLARAYTPSDYEMYDYPGGYAQRYDGEQSAGVRIDEFHSKFEGCQASTNAKGVCVGALFNLEQCPRAAQNREHLILATSYDLEFSDYEGMPHGEGSSCRCSFLAMPSAQQFRPWRLTPKPFVQGPQTAVVVGPDGEEIYTDNFGRVKVQFHWDRRGKKDENSSCWIRVSHPWAGKGWGAISTPRIGQEVIVDFLEGDPDQPIIIGRVYNAEQMPPYALPANKTQSGDRSHSSLGGTPDNFNEITFEDKKGSELFSVQAEKDMKLLVKNNRTETVRANRSEQVGGNHSESVGGDHSTTVDGSMTVTVKRAKNELVYLASSEEVGLGRNLMVGAAYAITVVGAMNTAVGGAMLTEVVLHHFETVGRDRKLNVGKKLTIDAGDEIEIKTGAASVVMKKDGKIEISGVDVTMKSGAGKVNIDAGGIITIKGPMVKINT